ncbi:MAG: PilZ domain-containing protein [Thiogranum sp.]
MVEKRKHVRTELSGPVKVMHSQLGSVEVQLRDISNGGVFLFTGDQLGLPVGEVVRIQALDLEDAPVLNARIVRVETKGIALMFEED